MLYTQVLQHDKGFSGVYIVLSINQGGKRNKYSFKSNMTIIRSFDPINGIRDPKLVYIDNHD